jgi:hypothetical protein
VVVDWKKRRRRRRRKGRKKVSVFSSSSSSSFLLFPFLSPPVAFLLSLLRLPRRHPLRGRRRGYKKKGKESVRRRRVERKRRRRRGRGSGALPDSASVLFYSLPCCTSPLALPSLPQRKRRRGTADWHEERDGQEDEKRRRRRKRKRERRRRKESREERFRPVFLH